MKQQVLVIHGGTTFEKQEEYLNYLKTKDLTLEKIRQKKWKDTLQEKLGDNFDVLLPKMPNSENARYEEWKLWFERIINLVDDGIILVGHSMGGIFLPKYLSENIIAKKVKATILVAAPFDYDDPVETGKTFSLPPSLEKFLQQGGEIYLIQSQDDPVVRFEELEKYHRALPQAKVLALNGYGHFNKDDFPELVKVINDISG